MARRRRKPTKAESRRLSRQLAPPSKRDLALSMAGMITVRVLSDPNAARGVGMLLESLGKAMQRSAGAESTTEPTTETPPGNVFDLSAFRKEKSDG